MILPSVTRLSQVVEGEVLSMEVGTFWQTSNLKGLTYTESQLERFAIGQDPNRTPTARSSKHVCIVTDKT